MITAHTVSAATPAPAASVARVLRHMRRRRRIVATVAATATLALAVIGLTVGPFSLPLGVVIDVAFGGGSYFDWYILVNRRLPRLAGALLVGLALGCAGALTQAVTRNALASPDLLGVTQGAALAAVLHLTGAMALIPGLSDLSWSLSTVALVGSAVAGLAVVGIARFIGSGGWSVIIAGIGLAATIDGLIAWLLLSAESDVVGRAQVWLAGSLDPVDWGGVRLLAVVVPVGLLVAAALTAALETMDIGTDAAHAVGVPGRRVGLVALAVAVVLVGVSVSVAGAIAFVAFGAPRLAALLCGSAAPPPLVSAVVGAAVVVGADVVTRVALPAGVPVGVVTAAAGGVFLLVVLFRQTRGIGS